MNSHIHTFRSPESASTTGGSLSENFTPRNSFSQKSAVDLLSGRLTPGVAVSSPVAFDDSVGKESGSWRTAKFPAWKRALDLAVILVTLPLWLSGIVIIGIWIKLVSRGPLFFRQVRVGLGGRPFIILKFRSMKPNSDTASHETHFRQLVTSNTSMIKLDALNDQRLILGGRILRALGMDELPQLFNVIWGEMSLVGPRPCTVMEFQCYEEWQRARFCAPPGLTGYWQVNGKNRTTFPQMIEMDIRYAERMSLPLDLTILLATLPAVLLQAVEASWKTPPPDNAEKSAAAMAAGLGGHSTQRIAS